MNTEAFKTVKTSALIGPALDWAVARCEGYGPDGYMKGIDLRFNVGGKVSCMHVPINREYVRWAPSTDWAQGGPIIDREGVNLGTQRNEPGYSPSPARLWHAQANQRVTVGYGPTPLIAAMRCYVASKLGDEIDVPEELT